MRVIRRIKPKFAYDYIELNQGAFRLITFSAPASELWKILSINRRIEDKDEGYQRTLSPARVRDIAKYVSSNNPVPLSILVTLDKGKYMLQNKKVILDNTPDVGWVIDGQHRLAGAHESGTQICLPVVAFLELPIEDQIKQFVIINREAKGVPTSLYYDLLKHLPDKTASEMSKERATDIAHNLKKDEEAPFFGKIVSITAPKRGELSLNIFVKKVAPLVSEKGILNAYSVSEQEKIISNYYKALANVFPKEFKIDNSIFFQTLGFGALFRVLPAFFSICLKNHKGFSVKDATDTFNQISYFDFDDWKKYGTGNAAEIQAGDDLRTELEKSFEKQGDPTKIRL
jgi:DGQHR domain-containing protein